jgi:hypothetical protein
MMNPEALSILVDRMLDDALTPDERATLAKQIANDPTLHQQIADELALSLQIRATLANDANHRADLLMATLSGSRRFKVEQRIVRAMNTASRPASRRYWLTWSSSAVAALLLITLSILWSTQNHRPVASTKVGNSAPSNKPGPSAIASSPLRETPNNPAANVESSPSSTAPVVVALPPNNSVENISVSNDGEEKNSPSPSDAVAVVIANAAQTPDLVDPSHEKITEKVTPKIGVKPSPTPAIAQPPTVLASQAAVALTPQIPLKTLPQTQKKGPQLVMLSGKAHLRRRDRESTIGANTQLLPGDEINVDMKDDATFVDDRGITWQCGPYTRLSINHANAVEAPRQPISLNFGTIHISAGLGLRPLITTPHIHIDTEAADVTITVTSAWTRVETMGGSVRLGTNVKRPLAPGYFALILPGDSPAIFPAGQTRLAVINGRFTSDGRLQIPRILRGVSVALAAEAHATAVSSPLQDGAWLDQATSHHLNALVDIPKSVPAIRILKHPALSAWVADGDARKAIAIRQADPQRPLHLIQSAPARLAAWASSSELVEDDDAGSERATLAVVPVNAQIHANTWHALVRGAQGVIWTVNDHTNPGEILRPIAAEIEATQNVLTDGTRMRLNLGSDLSAARWDCPDQRLVVVVNRGSETRTVQVPHTRGLSPIFDDDSVIVEQHNEIVSATLPPGAVLALIGTPP